MQDAVEIADDLQTIRICPGLYNGNVSIEKNLTLIGAGGGGGAGNTILRGTQARTEAVRVGFGLRM